MEPVESVARRGARSAVCPAHTAAAKQTSVGFHKAVLLGIVLRAVGTAKHTEKGNMGELPMRINAD